MGSALRCLHRRKVTVVLTRNIIQKLMKVRFFSFILINMVLLSGQCVVEHSDFALLTNKVVLEANLTLIWNAG